MLGARGCSLLPCKALLETTANGGATWAKVTAPNVQLVPPFSDDAGHRGVDRAVRQ